MEIAGISADPSANEDWTDQFGLPNDPVVASGLDGKSGLAPLGTRKGFYPASRRGAESIWGENKWGVAGDGKDHESSKYYPLVGAMPHRARMKMKTGTKAFTVQQARKPS